MSHVVLICYTTQCSELAEVNFSEQFTHNLSLMLLVVAYRDLHNNIIFCFTFIVIILIFSYNGFQISFISSQYACSKGHSPCLRSRKADNLKTKTEFYMPTLVQQEADSFKYLYVSFPYVSAVTDEQYTKKDVWPKFCDCFYNEIAHSLVDAWRWLCIHSMSRLNTNTGIAMTTKQMDNNWCYSGNLADKRTVSSGNTTLFPWIWWQWNSDPAWLCDQYYCVFCQGNGEVCFFHQW